ncbi:MAG: hypothetical protein ACWGQW_14810 [bacterium]
MDKKPVITTTLRTHQEILDRLDKYAVKMELSRNQLMCNLLACGLDDLAVLDRLGMIRVGVGIRNLVETARSKNPRQLTLEMS